MKSNKKQELFCRVKTLHYFRVVNQNNERMGGAFLKTGVVDRLRDVDTRTGEVLDEIVRKNKYLAKSKEEFYLVYASLLGIFKKLSHPEVKVYCYLLENHIIGANIAITNKLRVIIGKETKLSSGTVSNALGFLTEKKLIYSPQRGIYKLNPRYAFQGSTTDRNRLLKFVLEVECPEC